MEDIKFIKRGFFERVLGQSGTNEPEIADCWNYENGKVVIDLSKSKELETLGGAIRLEGKNLPVRVLVVYAENGEYKAYHNKCTHIGGRRLDPVPGSNTVQCCSINKSTFDLNGNKKCGPASRPIKTYPTAIENCKLIVSIS